MYKILIYLTTIETSVVVCTGFWRKGYKPGMDGMQGFIVRFRIVTVRFRKFVHCMLNHL